MENKAKRLLNLSADKVNSYAFKDAPSIYWSWWHNVLSIVFVVLLLIGLSSVLAKAQAAYLPYGERIECRIEVENTFTGNIRVTYKAYDMIKIKEVGSSDGFVSDGRALYG